MVFFIKLTKISIDTSVKWHGFLTKLTKISIDVGAIMSIMIKLSCCLDDMMPNVMYVLINSVIEMIIVHLCGQCHIFNFY